MFRYLKSLVKEWTMCWMLGPRSLHCHLLPDLRFSSWRNVGVFVLAIFGMTQFVIKWKCHNKGKSKFDLLWPERGMKLHFLKTNSKSMDTWKMIRLQSRLLVLGFSIFFRWTKTVSFWFYARRWKSFLLKPQGAHHVIHIKPNVASKSGDISSWPVANPGVPNARISLHHQRIYSW